MFIEVLDLLRCVEPHEDSWLVASFAKFENRHLIEGILGCPVCGARYQVSDGVVIFGEPRGEPAPAPPPALTALELAAYLDLTAEGSSVAVTGELSGHAPGLAGEFGAKVFAVNPSTQLPVMDAVGVIRSNRLFPLAAGSLDGAAIDAVPRDEDYALAAKAVRVGGRLVLPASADIPPDVELIARDERVSVLRVSPPLLTLRKASR